MQTLRRGAMEEILRNLNRQFLTSQHFSVKFNDVNGTVVHITYLDQPEYTFRMLQRGSEPSAWQTIEAPGRIFTGAETTEHHHRYDSALGSVYAWIDRVCDEILFAAKEHGEHGPLDSLRDQVAAAANELPNPEKPFTSAELDEWMDKLKALLAKIQTLEHSHEIQQARIDQVLRELDELKTMGTTIPKRTWLKTAGNKVLDLMNTASTEGVKKLATEGAKLLVDYMRSSG